MAAALAAASDASAVGREIAHWSGPWGWSVQPASGVPDMRYSIALLMLTVATAAAAGVAVRGCGACPTERHQRRAEVHANASASLASYDARGARQALATVGALGTGRRGIGLGRVRSAALAVPWRDAVSALRTPSRVVEGAVLAGAGTTLGVLHADRPVALLVAMLVVYLGASRMLWPLRAELDEPDRARVLRPRIGRVLLAHSVVPVIVTTGAAMLATAGCAIVGALPAHGAASPLVAIAVTPMLVGCAGMSARRGGRLPPSVLVTALAADPSGGASFISAWLAFWPTVAATLGAVAMFLASTLGAAATIGAVLWTIVATTTLVHHLGREVTKP